MKCEGVQCGCAFIQKCHNICYALKMGHCWIIQYRSLEVRKPPPTQSPPHETQTLPSLYGTDWNQSEDHPQALGLPHPRPVGSPGRIPAHEL